MTSADIKNLLLGAFGAIVLCFGTYYLKAYQPPSAQYFVQPSVPSVIPPALPTCNVRYHSEPFSTVCPYCRQVFYVGRPTYPERKTGEVMKSGK